MLTLVIVANTFSQYQAFIWRWFKHIRSTRNMTKHFVWVSPNDQRDLLRLQGYRHGMFFVVTPPDRDLLKTLKEQEIHEVQFTEPY